MSLTLDWYGPGRTLATLDGMLLGLASILPKAQMDAKPIDWIPETWPEPMASLATRPGWCARGEAAAWTASPATPAAGDWTCCLPEHPAQTALLYLTPAAAGQVVSLASPAGLQQQAPVCACQLTSLIADWAGAGVHAEVTWRLVHVQLQPQSS